MPIDEDALAEAFEQPFDEIAPLVDRSPAATRQLVSRARRRSWTRHGPRRTWRRTPSPG